MAGGRGNTTTRNEIPDELKPLITSTANQLISGQFGMPIGQFMWHQPTQVAGLTPWEQHNLKQINRYGLNSGPNPYESEGMTAVRDAADVAYYNQIGLQNEGDARALNRINSMQDVQAQNIGLFNDFDRQGQAVTQQILNLANQNPYSPRTDADMLQALSQANILAGFNPKDLTDLEVESLTNSRDMYRRSGTTFDDLSTYEKEALGQLSRLGAQNQRELASLYEPDVEARRVLGQFTEGELGQSPATQAAMAAYERTIVPQLESRLALRGMANSGAAAEAFANAQSEALVPMLQQELQQRQAAAPMLMSLAEAQSGRERGDLARQMQAGLQIAGATSEAGARVSDRQRDDLMRALTLGGQFNNQIAGLGGLFADRERADLAQRFGANTQMAQQYQSVSDMLSDRDRQYRAQQLAAYGMGADQLYNLGGSFATREQANQAANLQAALANQGVNLQAAGQLFGYGSSIADREAGNRDARVAALQNMAQYFGGIGNQIETRDFDQSMQALQASSLPRDIQNQQYLAEADERARRQALAEQLLLAPISSGVLTSGIGQTVNARQSGLIPGAYK